MDRRSCGRFEAGGSSSGWSSSTPATDRESFLPIDLDAAALIDDTAFEHGLLVTSTHPQADGFAGDQTLLAPAYVSSDEELTEMIGRFKSTIEEVERVIKSSLTAAGRP